MTSLLPLTTGTHKISPSVFIFPSKPKTNLSLSFTSAPHLSVSTTSVGSSTPKMNSVRSSVVSGGLTPYLGPVDSLDNR